MVGDGSAPPHRFFAPALDPGDELVTLPREEAEHLARVLRLGPGDLVAVFDGRGNEYLARVVSASSRAARAQVLKRLEPAREPGVAVTLAQAVLKGDAMDDVVRDAVMLGAAAIQPLVTTRTETTVAQLMRGTKIDRWRRVALSAAKQSRRAVLPEVRGPLSLDSYLDEPTPERGFMLVEPLAGAPAETLHTLARDRAPREAAVFVGPEGGWSEAEWRAAERRGIRLMTLGDRTLRADAVPVAALSILFFVWEAG